MATGMGPPSSGGQATVASVVTSTLLAGLGFSGSVISSLPGSFWQTHSTNSGPTPTQHPAAPTAENTPSDSNIVTSEDSTEANNKQEEDREREEKKEEEEEEEEEEEDKGEEEKKNKVTFKDKKQDKTVPQKPTAPVPTAKHRERGRERADVNTENSTLAPRTVEEQVPRATETSSGEGSSKPTWLEEDDTVDMQLPSSSTETTELTDEERAHWPFLIHTGRWATDSQSKAQGNNSNIHKRQYF